MVAPDIPAYQLGANLAPVDLFPVAFQLLQSRLERQLVLFTGGNVALSQSALEVGLEFRAEQAVGYQHMNKSR